MLRYLRCALAFCMSCNMQWIATHWASVCARLPRDLSCVLLNAGQLQNCVSNYPAFQIIPLYPTRTYLANAY